jgi:eukaryotic-like serine/threonine-protein kinase
MAVRDGLLPERYTGPQPVGRGGMGEIYRATDTSLGRAVAIKVLDDRYARDESVRARFTREALAAARLSGNANIVTIYDVGEHNGRPFIVMEYLAGGSLEEKLRGRGAVPPGQALEWLEQAAAALDAAHREGVVHRDVKPANLLLDRNERVHVADFGIASAAGMDSLTQTGTVLGTASYLSPEQAQGERTTAASDLYSLAVVAFELFTGHRPFEAESVTAEAASHVTAPVPPVGDPELDRVFAKALAKRPADRYTSGAELVAALRAALESAAGPTRIVHVARSQRSRWLLPVLAAALVIAGIAAAVALTRGGSKPKPVAIKTVVQHVTQPGRTIVSTRVVTTSSPPPTTASSADPVAENDQAYSLMQSGDYNGALPLLQDAAQRLQGQGSLAEAYTDYNLGYTLMQLGNCSEALTWLERSKALQPSRKEVKDAIKQARRC